MQITSIKATPEDCRKYNLCLKFRIYAEDMLDGKMTSQELLSELRQLNETDRYDILPAMFNKCKTAFERGHTELRKNTNIQSKNCNEIAL